VFLAIGLCISAFCRTRVQALVCALLTWCVAVFAFDLVAMGAVVVVNSRQAAHEIEQLTDATHVASIADMHKAFEGADDRAEQLAARRARTVAAWLAINPVDLFRALNLPNTTGVLLAPWIAAFSAACWLACTLSLAAWRFRRIDI